MSLGGDYIYSVLDDLSSLSDYEIENARKVSSTNTSGDTINFYQITPFEGGLEYFQVTWSIDVRSFNQPDAEDAAVIVSNALNRLTYEVGGYAYFGITSILPVIPPATDQDAYNVPVQLLIRRR